MKFHLTAVVMLLVLYAVADGQPSAPQAGDGKSSASEALLGKLVVTDRAILKQLTVMEAQRDAAEKVLNALVKTDTATIKQLQTANAEITKLDREMKSLKDLAGEVRSTSQEVRKLAIEQAQLREDARNNRADKMALDTRLAAVEKQLQGKEATAAKQKQQFEALVPTVRDRKQVLIATVAEADSELKRLRGADKAGDDKTTDEHAVDRWLSTKTWVEVNTARHRDMKVQLDGGGPGGRLPVQQHNAVWKEWRDLGVELEKSPRRVSELERRVSPEANQAVMGATRKRDEAVRELEELRSRR